MKYLRSIKWSSLSILFILFLSPIVAHSATLDSAEITKRISSDINKVNETTDYLNDTKDSLDSMSQKITTYKDYFGQSSKYYQDNLSAVDDSLRPVLQNAKGADDEISSGLDTMANAVKNSDSSSYDRGLDSYNDGIKKLNDVAKQHDEALGITNPGPTYVWLSVIFGLISLTLLAKTRLKIVGEFSSSKKVIMLNLFKSSLWPAIGALITTIWYYSTPPGSSYYILWGPMLIGFIYFAIAIWNYLKIRRPLKIGTKAEYTAWQEKETKRIEKEEMEAEIPLDKFKYCPFCGFQHEKADKFCTSCGKKL